VEACPSRAVDRKSSVEAERKIHRICVRRFKLRIAPVSRETVEASVGGIALVSTSKGSPVSLPADRWLSRHGKLTGSVGSLAWFVKAGQVARFKQKWRRFYPSPYTLYH
jgi:hypothetical protein